MILESLFYGNFSPVEQVYPEDPEYRKALKNIELLMQQLYKTLPRKITKRSKKYSPSTAPLNPSNAKPISNLASPLA